MVWNVIQTFISQWVAIPYRYTRIARIPFIIRNNAKFLCTLWCPIVILVFWGWLVYPFKISLRLTLPAFPRPVSLSIHKPCQLFPEWQSMQPYLVLPTTLIHNIITFTWPCHSSCGRRISSTLPLKDSWVMVLILTSSWDGITCRSCSVRHNPEVKDDTKGKLFYWREAYALQGPAV